MKLRERVDVTDDYTIEHEDVLVEPARVQRILLRMPAESMWARIGRLLSDSTQELADLRRLGLDTEADDLQTRQRFARAAMALAASGYGSEDELDPSEIGKLLAHGVLRACKALKRHRFFYGDEPNPWPSTLPIQLPTEDELDDEAGRKLMNTLAESLENLLIKGTPTELQVHLPEQRRVVTTARQKPRPLWRIISGRTLPDGSREFELG